MTYRKDIYSRLNREKEIVAFCGKKRSGKDTAAEAIKDLGYRPIAFADPIKGTCQTVFHFTDRQIYGNHKSENDGFWGFTPRWAMQMVGTELFRDGIDQDVWVKSLLRRVDSSDHDKFAVTDVRFPNEVEHLRKAGAQLVYIQRPETHPDLDPLKKWFAKKGGVLKKVANLFTEFGSEYHPSEILLDDHEISETPDIINDSSIEDFKVAVRHAVETNHLSSSSPIYASSMKTV